MTVIVPVKSLEEGKSRLAGRLDGVARRQLCAGMLDRTLEMLLGFDEVIVVSEDPAVGEKLVAVPSHFRFVHASPPRDLNRALDQARVQLREGRSILVVPTDLVFLDAGTLRAFASNPRCFAIAPDYHCTGTNLLLVPASRASAFKFDYGAGSFGRHVAQMRRLGCEPRIFRSARTAFDLDTPDDLELLGTESLVSHPGPQSGLTHGCVD